jgi:hypothetical protein
MRNAVVGVTFLFAATMGSLAANAYPAMPRPDGGSAPGIVQVWGGCGWGWHPVPGHWSNWRGGWVPPHCAQNGGYGGPYGGYYRRY